MTDILKLFLVFYSIRSGILLYLLLIALKLTLIVLFKVSCKFIIMWIIFEFTQFICISHKIFIRMHRMLDYGHFNLNSRPVYVCKYKKNHRRITFWSSCIINFISVCFISSLCLDNSKAFCKSCCCGSVVLFIIFCISTVKVI